MSFELLPISSLCRCPNIKCNGNNIHYKKISKLCPEHLLYIKYDCIEARCYGCKYVFKIDENVRHKISEMQQKKCNLCNIKHYREQFLKNEILKKINGNFDSLRKVYNDNDSYNDSYKILNDEENHKVNDYMKKHNIIYKNNIFDNDRLYNDLLNDIFTYNPNDGQFINDCEYEITTLSKIKSLKIASILLKNQKCSHVPCYHNIYVTTSNGDKYKDNYVDVIDIIRLYRKNEIPFTKHLEEIVKISYNNYPVKIIRSDDIILDNHIEYKNSIITDVLAIVNDGYRYPSRGMTQEFRIPEDISTHIALSQFNINAYLKDI